MDTGLDETQVLIRNSARDFLRTRCDSSFVRAMASHPNGCTDEMWQEITNLGWPGLTIGERYGGAGLGFAELAVLLEETGAALMPGPLFSTAVAGAEAIKLAGSETQKSDLLPLVASGQLRLALALQEEHAGWGRHAVQCTRAEPAHGSWRISGEKRFVLDATAADKLVVAARTSEFDRSDPGEGLTLVLIDSKEPGVYIRPERSISMEPVATVVFNDAVAPNDAVLGEPGDAWPTLERVLQFGAAGKCAEMAGAAQRVLDMTVEYVKDRSQFGRAVGAFQAVQHHCADMAIDTHGMRQLARRAAWMLGKGTEATREVSQAKAFASEALPRVCATAHQCHGAIGYTWEHDLHLFTRRAVSQRLAFGDAEHHRRILATQSGL